MLDKALRDLLYKECKGCDKEHMVLWMMLELLKLKASNGWSDTSFSTLLDLLTKVLPKPNGLPSSTYQAKIICLLTLGIEKIYACPNHCILYQKKHEFKDRCPKFCTDEMIKVRRLRMTPTKRAKKARMKEEECHSRSGH
jgi:hypothetical protein